MQVYMCVMFANASVSMFRFITICIHIHAPYTAASTLPNFQPVCHLLCQCIHHCLLFLSTDSCTAKCKAHVKIADNL